MVKVELSYNPYLSETKILFNGKEPHINSLVEKYKDCRLEDWIQLLPHIFCDEMNGYDFEVVFSGTDLDFKELKHVFHEQGISENSVCFSQKKILEDRETKESEINALFKWLEENRNRSFDFTKFKQENNDLFNENFQIVILHHDGVTIPDLTVNNASIVSVNKINELENADLTDIPFVYAINEASAAYLPADMKILLSRHDIKQQQMFFLPDKTVSKDMVIRVLQDIGVPEPTIISSLNDESLRRYFLIYPFTNSLRDAINTIDKTVQKLTDEQNKQKSDNEKSNEQVYKKIESLQNILNNLRQAYETFEDQESLKQPDSWQDLQDEMDNRIRQWKARKIKTTNDNEATKLAKEFSQLAQESFEDFIEKFKSDVNSFVEQTSDEFIKMYESGDEDLDYRPVLPAFEVPQQDSIPDISNNLMNLKVSDAVEQKPTFFKPVNKGTNNLILINSYYFDTWREYATKILNQKASDLIAQTFQSVQTYAETMIQAYQEHLQSLINIYNREKDKVSSQLSDDERKFQDDIRWLSTFSKKLEIIEKR